MTSSTHSAGRATRPKPGYPSRLSRCSRRGVRGARSWRDMEAFYFRGKARQVRVWDEAILPSRILTVGQYDISNLFKRFSRENAALTDELKVVFDRLEKAASGDLVDVPDLEKYDVALEDALSWVNGNDEDMKTVEALWGLSGRSVRVRKDKHVAVLDYEDILPVDLAPMLILDASGQQRRTYEFWFKGRGKLSVSRAPRKVIRA